MQTRSTILKLVQSNMFTAKLNIKGARSIIPIKKEDPKLLKFKDKDKLHITSIWHFTVVTQKPHVNLQRC